MKAVVGIDSSGHYHSALNLLARLKIEGTAVELLHVDETAPFYSFDDFEIAPDMTQVQHEVDLSILTDAEESAHRLGLEATRLILVGSPASRLMGEAGEHQADLICVGSSQKSKFSSLFFGSTGRALATGAKQSVLIGKGVISPDGPITAVLTTDHSSYSNRALDLFVGLKPTGIKRLIVLTVLDERMVGGVNANRVDSLRTYVEAKSASVAEELRGAGFPAEHRVVDGQLGESIDAQMQEVGADLLIMGAQGHGFIERIHIGSASLKQVVATRHPIWILRPSP